MKKNIEKRISAIAGAFAGMISTVNFCAFAASAKDDTGFDKVTTPIVKLLDSLMGPLLAIVGSVGALYCVILGVKYAKAEEPQDREKAKSHLKNAVIGFIIIFVLILALNILMDSMTDWVNANAGSTVID